MTTGSAALAEVAGRPGLSSTRLHRFAVLTAGLSFFTLFAGGMVTSTGSGLAVPDWPLSFGQYFPRMAGGVFFEHGHRMAAGLTGLLTAVLALWVLSSEPRRWVRRVTAAVAFGVVVQAVLGGVTVLYGLPPEVSIVHACLGQAVFCGLAAIAQGTSPWYQAGPAGRGSLWRWGAAAAAALYLQLVLGAVLRHTGGGLIWHLGGAALAAAAVWSAAYRHAVHPREVPSLAALTPVWAAAVALQGFLGLGALAARSARAIGPAALLPTAHQALGALILCGAVLWAMRARREGA